MQEYKNYFPEYDNSNFVGIPFEDDGSSGTWTARYESMAFAYTDDNGNQQNPESVGPVSLKGVTLTSGVTYTLTN